MKDETQLIPLDTWGLAAWSHQRNGDHRMTEEQYVHSLAYQLLLKDLASARSPKRRRQYPSLRAALEARWDRANWWRYFADGFRAVGRVMANLVRL